MIALRSLLLAPLLFGIPSAWAQDDEDHQRICPLLTEQLVRAIIPAIAGHGGCAVRCSGCGCKGGPGYRDSDGKCVGYANVIQKCGPPPHRGCQAECAPVSDGCDHGRVWLKGFLAHAGLSVQFTAANVLSPSQQHPLQGADQAGDGQTKH